MSRKFLSVLMAFLGVLCLGLALALPVSAQKTSPLSPIEQLGKLLFFDASLSKNSNQSCATCHAPEVGYTGPDSAINAQGSVYPGSTPTLFGNRKPPSAAYAGDSPSLHYDSSRLTWVGGMFWDGRADGSQLGDPLAEQAKGPFLNPLEMGLTSPEALCGKVKTGSYTALYEQVWGAGSLDCSKAAIVYDQIGQSIAAYERSSEVNPFSSKFDVFWDKATSKRLDVTRITAANWTTYRNLGLADTELYGLAVFNDPTQANCASCHSLQPGSKGYPLFTDYSYRNLGLPRNPQNPFYTNLDYNPDGVAWVDNGLGGHLGSIGEPNAELAMGKMKVPTLRNVDKRPSAGVIKAYGHNGAFKSLPEVIAFYAARGMNGGMTLAPAPRVGMGNGRMGNGMMMGGRGMGGGMMCGMQLSSPEVNENLAALNRFRCMDQQNILAFLRTLSDGFIQR